MNLLETVDAARNLLNEPLEASRSFPDNTSSFWTDSILTTYHNLVQQDLQNVIVQADEEFFVTASYLGISAGTAEYTLPSDLIKVRRVEDNRDPGSPIEIVPVRLNDRGILYSSEHEIRSRSNFQGGYYLRGNQIVLTDTPTFTNASAIRVIFSKRVADVTAGTNTSEIPAQYHHVTVWGIVQKALFQQQSDPEIATKEYEKGRMALKMEIENRQTQRPRRVARAQTWRME